MAAFCFLLLMMSHGVKGRWEENVFRLVVHTKTLLTRIGINKGCTISLVSKKPSSSVTAGHYMAVFLSSYSAPRQNSFISTSLLMIDYTRSPFKKQYHSTKHVLHV